ncbi:MAG TPA: cobalamin-dependent protein [Candidatus Pelethocola excrementipullorum]|nr:cobalamin-dependent protein [Candidatus Pelethocola excrementipullorum]
MTFMEEIRYAIEEGKPRAVEKTLQEAIKVGTEPRSILDDAMLPAMRKVGHHYRDEDGDVARILAAARAMKKGMDYLEPYLEGEYFGNLGKVILGTAGGDLHDVGKNLVGIMFRSVGFDVIDLGVDVSTRRFINAVKEHPEVDIVCVSSLLTTSMPEMRHIVHSLNELHNRKDFKVMVGGGPITKEFAIQIGADGYTENAVDAAEIARSFMDI